jgi:arginyl-tRNA synthetase
MIRDDLKKNIKKAVYDLRKDACHKLLLREDICAEGENKKVSFKYPPQREYGDYYINLRQDLAKKLKKSIEKKMPNFLDKVTFVAPSFLNFYIKPDYLKKEVNTVIKKGKDFGKSTLGKKQKTNIEFVSANPTGKLHIGNGRGAFYGDVLANVLSFVGFDVTREYFVNNGKTSKQIKELGKTALGGGMAYLTPYLQEKIVKNRAIQSLKRKLKIDEDTVVVGDQDTIVAGDFDNEAFTEYTAEAGYLLAQDILKDIKELILKKLKINFDVWFSEEEELLKTDELSKTLSFLKKKNLVNVDDSALWLKTSKFDDNQDRVIIRSTGEPTYFLSDITYHKNKIKRKFKKIIDIWGADHQGHAQRMHAAMEMLNYKNDFEVLTSQIVNLKGGQKISKRSGQVIELEKLVDEVGLDVCRFFYISKGLSSQMEFDFELAKLQTEKNPVYYIQYAHTRAASILAKVKVNSKKLEKGMIKTYLLEHNKELELIRQISRFPEIVEDIAKDYQVQRLTEYGRELAVKFNHFYRDCRVMGEESDLANARICLVMATKITLFNLLSLMGISAPERM